MARRGKDTCNVTPTTIRVAKRIVTASARARVARERQRPTRAAHDTHVLPPEPQDDYDVRMGDTATVGTSSSSTSTKAWILEGPNGGGPVDHTMLTSFKAHVAYAIWSSPKEPHGALCIQSRLIKLGLLPRDDENMGEAFKYIEGTGLQYLLDTYVSHHNAPLISAFVERWHPETNSFHLPFGEMTITLTMSFISWDRDVCRFSVRVRFIERIRMSIHCWLSYLRTRCKWWWGPTYRGPK